VKELVLIAAAGEGNELGNNGNLPWHLPDDFKHFKETTTGHAMIMGRKTFDTFPRPLPNRQHIIITRDRGYRVSHANCKVVHSLEAAIEAVSGMEKAFVIGGGEIYRQALPQATGVVLTRVHGHFDADTFFPEIRKDLWRKVNSTHHPKDERHDYAFTIETYVRNG
jgi:dihydrofolate reductase